jgi:hypothetical protein
MRFIRVTLTQTNVAEQVSTLAGLTSKHKNIARFVIYPEEGNDVDATNGPARIGGSDVDRVAAGGVKGFPLLPGIVRDDLGAAVGMAGPYSLEQLYIMGAIGDVFQIGYVII